METTDTRSTVRVATPDDLFDVMVLCRAFSREAPDAYKGFNADKVQVNLLAAMNADNTEVFVLEKNGEIVGILVGLITELMFNNIVVASELAWYVDKDNRGIGSIKLVKAYEKWAKDFGANRVTMTDLSQLKELGVLYGRLGYELAETTYVKEI